MTIDERLGLMMESESQAIKFNKSTNAKNVRGGARNVNQTALTTINNELDKVEALIGKLKSESQEEKFRKKLNIFRTKWEKTLGPDPEKPRVSDAAATTFLKQVQSLKADIQGMLSK